MNRDHSPEWLFALMGLGIVAQVALFVGVGVVVVHFVLKYW